MTKERYLEMCEMMGRTPDPDLMPIDFQDFPFDIQELFIITNMLSDRWDGMSGSYLGKDMNLIPYLFDVYGIDNPKQSLQIINLIIRETQKSFNDELKRKRAAEKRKKK